jgi:murein DD-endopeptidase MepM/ murein hydrolase activator NlpD
LLARLIHMDCLAVGVTDGAWVRAGQSLGVLSGRVTEEFPHLHVAFELLSSGERIDRARSRSAAGR